MSGKKKKAPRQPVVVKGLGKKSFEEHELRPKKQGKSCVVFVGSVGSGKTTTIQKFLRETTDESPLEAGQFRAYGVEEDGDAVADVWVDSSGASWEEKHFSDSLSLQENLLQFLDNQGVTEISAVVWNILPSVSKDQLTERQAEFINMLGPKKVWGNVVVVCKESSRPERDAAGALRLAEEYSAFRRPAVVGYRLLSSFDEEQRAALEGDEGKRDEFNAPGDDEVRRRLEEALSECAEPIPVFGEKEGEGDEDDLEDLFLDPVARPEVGDGLVMGLPPYVYAKPF